MAKDIVSDGKWHVAVINLKELLGEKYQSVVSSSIGFGSINEAVAPKGSFRLDDVCFLSTLPPVPMLYISQYDETGIRESKCKISKLENDVPTESFVYGTNKVALSTPGTYFIHANITDGAGNTSETIHLPFICETAAPKLAEDGLEAIAPSRFYVTTMKGKPANISKNQPVGEDGNTLLVLNYYGTQKSNQTLCFARLTSKKPFKGLSLDIYGQRISKMKIQAIAFPSLQPGPVKALSAKESPVHVVSDAVDIVSDGKWQRSVKLRLEKELETQPEYIGLLITHDQKDNPSLIIDNLKPITK